MVLKRHYKNKKGNLFRSPFNKLLQTCKPDFVSRFSTGGYHLSCCYITATILLPTLPAPENSGVNGQLTLRICAKRDIRGITAHKVYPSQKLLTDIVSSYLAFSPLPRAGNGTWRLFSVALSPK